MRGMSIVAKAGLLAAVAGAGTWLIVGIWQYNWVAAIFGSGTQSATTAERIIYVVFGVGAIICLPLLAAALGSSRAGRRRGGDEEREAPAPSRPSRDAGAAREGTERDEARQLADYQEFQEFQAWRASKRAQEATTETSPVPVTEAPASEVVQEGRRMT